MSMQWLLARAPGFQALPEEDRAAIFNFTFLWSLFEAQVMGNFARADLICAKADEWQAAGTLDADQYDGGSWLIFASATSPTGNSRTTSPTCIFAPPISPTSSGRSSTGATTTRAIGC